MPLSRAPFYRRSFTNLGSLLAAALLWAVSGGGSSVGPATLMAQGPGVLSLTLSPTTIAGGSGDSSTGTVTLSGPAPADVHLRAERQRVGHRQRPVRDFEAPATGPHLERFRAFRRCAPSNPQTVRSVGQLPVLVLAATLLSVATAFPQSPAFVRTAPLGR